MCGWSSACGGLTDTHIGAGSEMEAGLGRSPPAHPGVCCAAWDARGLPGLVACVTQSPVCPQCPASRITLPGRELHLAGEAGPGWQEFC
jgi:hypothetical protein